MVKRSWTAGIILLSLALGFFCAGRGVAGAELASVDGKMERAIEVTAAGNEGNMGDGEQAAISLEQAIQIARQAFKIPAELDQFSSGFSQSDENSFWELRWYRSSMQGGEMSVRVNSDTGEIWSMYKWLPPAAGVEYRGLPVYTREKAQAIAAAFIQKLHPERFGETILQPGRDYIPPLSFKERGAVEYNFNYARVIEGVLYPDNGINVAVNGDTGEVIRFDLNWGETRDFPPPVTKISLPQARQIFLNESAPELNYFRPYAPYGMDAPVKLVYRQPENRRQVLIDALTGKLLNQDMNYYYGYGGGGDAGAAPEYSLKQQDVQLNPAEEMELDEVKNLLSRDKALEKARSTVGIPADYTLTSSRLEQDYMIKSVKTWNFSWQAGDKSVGGGLNVTIDAVNGDLIAFNCYENIYDEYKNQEVKYSEEEARRIAEDFIKKNQPNRWEQVLLESLQPVPGPVLTPLEEPVTSSYAIRYTRIVKDVKFPDNGFYVNVNSATGKITSYRMNWWDLVFPDPEGVISREEAANKYLKEAPLKVGYLRLWPREGYWKQPDQEAKIHLVYYQANLNFEMLDAFTGQPLNGEGGVVHPEGAKAEFSDMEGHPAREAVEQLAAAGIVVEDSGKFRPDDAVTQAELIAMLVRCFDQSPGVAAGGEEPWYQVYFEKAARIGIIQAGEKPEPEAPVNREILARLMIHSMDLYKVARFSDIYVLDFQDAEDISGHLKGHAVLSAALGLIKTVEGRFEPKGVVTRAEAAETVVRFLKNS
jgi:hypothetical protein